MKSLEEDRARDLTASVIAAPVIPLTTPTTAALTIISTGDDFDTMAVAERVEVEKRAHDSLSVIQCLDEAIGTPIDTLDLIGHAVSTANYLRIGEWVISRLDTDAHDTDLNDDDMMAFVVNQLGPKLAQANVHALRLLGCGTATTHEGFLTMKTLAAWLNASAAAPFVVYGTNNVLILDDFGPDGFLTKSESKLHPSSAAGPAQPLVFTNRSLPEKQVRVRLTSHMLLAEPILADARVSWPISIMSDELAQQIWSLVEPEVGWSLPGLLAQPQRELLLPIQSIAARPAGVRAPSARSARGDGITSNLFYRVQILLGHQLVRVIPSEQHLSAMGLTGVVPREGLLYRVSDPARLAKLVP